MFPTSKGRVPGNWSGEKQGHRGRLERELGSMPKRVNRQGFQTDSQYSLTPDLDALEETSRRRHILPRRSGEGREEVTKLRSRTHLIGDEHWRASSDPFRVAPVEQ